MTWYMTSMIHMRKHEHGVRERVDEQELHRETGHCVVGDTSMDYADDSASSDASQLKHCTADNTVASLPVAVMCPAVDGAIREEDEEEEEVGDGRSDGAPEMQRKVWNRWQRSVG
jgi:hypothetical protein